MSEDRTPAVSDDRPWPPPGPDVSWWQGAGAATNTPALVPRPERPPQPPDAREEPAGAQDALADGREEPPDAREEPPDAREEPPDAREEPPDAQEPLVRRAPRQSSQQGAWVSGPTRPVAAAPPPQAVLTQPRPPAPTDPSAPAFPLPPDSGELAGRPLTPRPRSSSRPVPVAPRAVRRARRGTRRPIVGLPALFLFALLATFFAWFSATQFSLWRGNGDVGTATVSSCTTGWSGRDCVATFTTGDYQVTKVHVLGVDANNLRAGASMPARLMSRSARLAYAGDGRGLTLRWVLGLILVLLCGLGIGWSTGASRLAGRAARVGAYVASVATPLLLAAGFFAAAWR